MAGSVVGHDLPHVFEQCLTVFRLCHVDEVDDYNSAHVAEPELTGYFVGGAEIDIQGIRFLVAAGL